MWRQLVLQESDRTAIADAYRPILRGYLLWIAAYYGVMCGAHLWFRRGSELALLLTASGLAAVFALIAFRYCARPRSFAAMERIGLAANFAIFANVWVALEIAFVPSKLVYFIVMTMIFAAAGISLRQILVSVALAVGGLTLQLTFHAPNLELVYGFIAFGAAFAAIGIWGLNRRGLLEVIDGRRRAALSRDRAKEEASVARTDADTDSLTGLASRRSYFDQFEHHITAMQLSGSHFAIVLVDFDGFKAVNENFGHHVGDKLLIEVASRLRATCPHDIISRLGGDEFAILSESPEAVDRPFDYCTRIQSIATQPFDLDGKVVRLSASIGCVKCDEPALSFELAVEHVNFALSYAKQKLKGEVVVFADEHAREIENLFNIDQALRRADLDAELSIALQPQFDCTKQKTLGFEALARWQSPELGPVSPGIFIRVAESSGMMAKLNVVLLRKALLCAKELPRDLYVSFNLSSHDIISSRSIDEVIEIVRAAGIDPHRIEFEVTETAMMADFDRARENLLRLSARGHRISVDDFGAGYSNFAYLKLLPINKLKIDRSFVRDCPRDPTAVKLIRSMVHLTRGLSMDCVVEGVETAEELAVLRSTGIRVIQGYIIAKPMETGAIAGYLLNEASARLKNAQASVQAGGREDDAISPPQSAAGH